MNFNMKPEHQQNQIKVHYYPYRAFGSQSKIVYSMRFVTRRAILLIYCPGNIINIARALCDQSFNIDLHLRYVVGIHSSENSTMPRPP